MAAFNARMRQRIFSQVSISQQIFWWIFRIAIVLCLVFQKYSTHEQLGLSLTVTLILSFLWDFNAFSFPQASFLTKFSPKLQTFIDAQFILTSIIGGYFDLYYKLWWWDSACHVLGAIMLTFIGYELVCAVSEDEHNSHYTVPISIFVICSFCIAMTAGTIWEIMEFCDDQIAGADSQHWDYSRLEDAKSIFYLHQAIPAGRYPIIDTMTDIICNLCGSIAGAISLAFFPYRQKGRQIDKDCEQYRLSHKNKKTGA
jgi:hypothetical protein